MRAVVRKCVPRRAARPVAIRRLRSPQNFATPRTFPVLNMARFYTTETTTASTTKQADPTEYISKETWEKLQRVSGERLPEGVDDATIDEAGSKRMTGFLGGRKISLVKKRPVRKWYTQVTPQLDPEADKWTVLLDGRNMLTRTDRGLYVASEEAALLLASEFEDQGEIVVPSAMPFMDAVCRSIDDIPKYRSYYTKEIEDFLACDHVCIREPPSRKEEYKLQQEFLEPIVKAFKEVMGLEVAVSSDSYQLNHPAKTMDTLRVLIDSMDNLTFFGFHQLTHAVKSVVTAFCLWHGLITVEQAFNAVQLEELYNQKKHGVVEGVHDLKAAQIKVDIVTALLFLQTTNYQPPEKNTIELLGDCSAMIAAKKNAEWEKAKEMKVEMYKNWKKFMVENAKTQFDKDKIAPFVEMLETRAEEELTEVEKEMYRSIASNRAHEGAANTPKPTDQ